MNKIKTYSTIWGQYRDFSRLKIHGGWLVYSCAKNKNETITAESMTYVPDPNHEWVIK